MPEAIRIGLVLVGGDSWRGGAEYCVNLIRALAPLERRGEVSLAFFAHEADGAALADAIPGFSERVVPAPRRHPRPPLWTRTWNRLRRVRTVGSMPLQESAARDGIQFLYPYDYPYQPLRHERRRVASAAWIPDFQHRRMPEFFSREELAARDAAHSHAARVTDCLVVSSRVAEEDFRTFHDREATPTEILHFHTWPHDRWFRENPDPVVAARRLPTRFFLCANQFWVHKNHETAFRAVGILKQRGVHVNLVCTGLLEDHRRPDHAGFVRRLIVDLGIDDRVFLLGLIPRSDQIQLYRQSIAVVQPSLFEGWSTVVEDCRALGKSVLLSDLPVHREQSPPGCRFFPARSAEMLADLMATGWDALPSGPQAADETAARRESQRATDTFARTFVAIATRTAERRGSGRCPASRSAG